MPPPWRTLTLVAVALGLVARLAFLAWHDPWTPHHPDEIVLPYESLAMWEGITPREVGWPAGTTRVVLSGAFAATAVAQIGGAVWRERHQPDRAMKTLTDWIGRQYVHPELVFLVGRFVSFGLGALSLLAMVWSLHRWTGPLGTLTGVITVAFGAIAVGYSEYVLADTTGLLFSILVVGLAARPSTRAIYGMAALAGLAACSKFHFGLWLLTPLLCAWLDPQIRLRLRVTLLASAIALGVGLALVPWFWTNPLLGLKEFTGVVLIKISGEGVPVPYVGNLVTTITAVGFIGWAGALLGAGSPELGGFRRYAPVLLPVVIGAGALVVSEFVFARYTMALLPGLAPLAGAGWQRALEQPRQTVRRLAAVAFVALLLLHVRSLVTAESLRAESDVDLLASRWILAHVPRGSRVATYDETISPLPRSKAILQACVQRMEGPQAYIDKWAVEVGTARAPEGQPMRSVLLTDEAFFAYWCQRELDVTTDPGYAVVLYHNEPRFWAILESEAVDQFRSRQLDVLVMNHPVDGLTAARIVTTHRGTRFIYAWPDRAAG